MSTRSRSRSRCGARAGSGQHAGLSSWSPMGRPTRRPEKLAHDASMRRGLAAELAQLDLATLRQLLASHPDAADSDVARAIDAEIRRRLVVPGLDA